MPNFNGAPRKPVGKVDSSNDENINERRRRLLKQHQMDADFTERKRQENPSFVKWEQHKKRESLRAKVEHAMEFFDRNVEKLGKVKINDPEYKEVIKSEVGFMKDFVDWAHMTLESGGIEDAWEMCEAVDAKYVEMKRLEKHDKIKTAISNLGYFVKGKVNNIPRKHRNSAMSLIRQSHETVGKYKELIEDNSLDSIESADVVRKEHQDLESKWMEWWCKVNKIGEGNGVSIEENGGGHSEVEVTGGNVGENILEALKKRR